MAFSGADVLNRAKGTVTVGSTAYAETLIPTNLSLDRGYIWLIHQILFWPTVLTTLWDDVAAGSQEYIIFHVARESKSDILSSLTEADLVAMWKTTIYRTAAIGTDAGPMWHKEEWPARCYFPVPMAYAGSGIYFGAKTSCATGKVFSIEIQHTLVKVKDADYLRVAASLLMI